MSTPARYDRNWFVGLLAIVGVALALVFAIFAMTGPATGDAPGQAGPVVRVMVGKGHGSGVHIGGGYVLTAEHVVARSVSAPKDKPVPVVIRDDRDFEVHAEVLWSNDREDVALLFVEHLPAASVNLSCRTPALFEPITVAGNPLDQTFLTFTGLVAGPPRHLPKIDRVAIPLDATALPGMSGGPVFDAQGYVVGMVAYGVEGMEMAIGSAAICRLLAR